MTHQSQFPIILKQLRASKNLTQDDLAKLLQVSRSTIAGYESRNKQPDYDKLVYLANYFQVTIDYLLTGNPNSLTSPAQLISNRELDCILLQHFHELTYEHKKQVIEYASLLAHKDH